MLWGCLRKTEQEQKLDVESMFEAWLAVLAFPIVPFQLSQISGASLTLFLTLPSRCLVPG